jgi:hypothetical protein
MNEMRISYTADSTSGMKQEIVLDSIWDEHSKCPKMSPAARYHNVTPNYLLPEPPFCL